MKKLLFIIPKIVFKSLLIVLFCCQIQALYGQIHGCHVVVGMSDRLFYTSYGAGSPTEWQTVPSGTITPTGETGGYRSDGTATYGCIADLGGTCTVYQQYEISPGPPQVIGMRPYRTGVFANIAPINCPIDDYIPALFIFTLGIAVVYIKRVPKLINESKHHHGSI